MRIYLLSARKLRGALLFGLAVLLVQVLAARYLAETDLEQADLDFLKERTVFIDPGHGGIDSGARYNHLLEKDITLALSRELGRQLEAQGARVVYTREGDVDYYTKGKGGKRNDLLARVEKINRSGADVFVSVHCNAVKGSQWFGAQVFYNARREENQKIAEGMQALLRAFPPGNKRQAKEDAQILILKEAQLPGVLVEAGYLSNPKEAALLSDAAYREQFAGQLVKALAWYFQLQSAVK